MSFSFFEQPFTIEKNKPVSNRLQAFLFKVSRFYYNF